jgi:hypothetical protein
VQKCEIWHGLSGAGMLRPGFIETLMILVTGGAWLIGTKFMLVWFSH